jgi:hypothetical protein
VLCFCAQDEIPGLLNKIALWMGDDFEFGSFSNPSEELLKGLGQTEAPVILAFIPQENKDGATDGRVQFAPAKCVPPEIPPMRPVVSFLFRVLFILRYCGEGEGDGRGCDSQKAEARQSLPLID